MADYYSMSDLELKVILLTRELNIYGSTSTLIKRLERTDRFFFPDIPRINETECAKLKAVELKRLLKERALGCSGAKFYLSRRLLAFEENAKTVVAAASASQASQDMAVIAPFRFQSLPPEMRNMIYHLIVEAENSDNFVLPDLSKSWKMHLENNVRTVAQPTLFRTCKQIRAEALGIFYREHHFEFMFDLAIPGFKTTLAWLTTIEMSNSSSIRRFTIRFYGPRTTDVGDKSFYKFTNSIHARLSEHVTVVYRGMNWYGLNWLWGMAQGYLKLPRKPSTSLPTFVYNRQEFTIEMGKFPIFQGPHRTEEDESTLTFKPGMLWFGKGPTIRPRKRILTIRP